MSNNDVLNNIDGVMIWDEYTRFGRKVYYIIEYWYADHDGNRQKGFDIFDSREYRDEVYNQIVQSMLKGEHDNG